MSSLPPPLPPGSYPPPPPGPPPSWSSGPYGSYGGDDPLVSRDLESWVSKSVALVKLAWKPMLVVHLVAAIPTFVLSIPLAAWADDVNVRIDRAETISGGDVLQLLGAALALGIVGVLVSTWGTLCSFWIAARTAAGADASIADGLRFGLRRLFPYLGWVLCCGLLSAVGFLACIAPGVWLAVTFYATLLGVVAFEQGRYGSTFSRCFALVKGRWWETFGRMLLLLLANLVVGGLVSVAVGLVSLGSSLLAQFFFAAVGAAIGVVTTTLLLVQYADLRNRQHPVTTASLVGELGA